LLAELDNYIIVKTVLKTEHRKSFYKKYSMFCFGLKLQKQNLISAVFIRNTH